MNRSPIGVISDIHGNRRALEAVFGDAVRRGVRRFLNLGDAVYGPLDGAGAMRSLAARDVFSVRGNEDRILFEAGAGETSRTVLARLSVDDAERIRSWPRTARTAEGFLLFHGTPEADDAYLLHDVTPRGAIRRKPAEIAARLAGIDAPVILCGHDHVPFRATLPDGRLVVNPGSVGLPAYSDDAPFPHVMECGSPGARYALLRPVAGGWEAEAIVAPYDHDSAAREAEAAGRGDWARWIRTGRAAVTR